MSLLIVHLVYRNIHSENAAERVEKTWTKRLQAELGTVRARYENEIESLKKELMEMNASFAEKDARRRVQMAEEKAELVPAFDIHYE